MKTLLFLLTFILLTTFRSIGQPDTSKNRVNITDYIFNPNINESDSLNNNLFVFLDSVLAYKENGKWFDNAVVILKKFPKNWVKNKDIDTLIHILKSKRKCKCAFNIVYSGVPGDNDYSELGGYVIEFINSYIQKRQVDFGLYSCPRIDEGKVDEILNWWKETKKQQQ